jgi:hypothetical protein
MAALQEHGDHYGVDILDLHGKLLRDFSLPINYKPMYFRPDGGLEHGQISLNYPGPTYKLNTSFWDDCNVSAVGGFELIHFQSQMSLLGRDRQIIPLPSESQEVFGWV